MTKAWDRRKRAGVLRNEDAATAGDREILRHRPRCRGGVLVPCRAPGMTAASEVGKREPGTGRNVREERMRMETGRLDLRRFTAADVDLLYGLDNDPEVMRYLNGGAPVAREVIAREILPGFL